MDPDTEALANASGEYLRSQEELRFFVLPLYDARGRKRSKEAIQKQGYRAGYINIEAVDPGSIEGRPTRRARMESIHCAHVAPYFGDLYDPQLVFMDHHCFVLRGYNMRDIGYGNELTMQVWVVKKCAN